jgi:hypothetical protein
VGTISKFAAAVDTPGASCTREHMEAMLEHEAVRAQAHFLIQQSISEAGKITTDYKDAVVAIVDWEDVE